MRCARRNKGRLLSDPRACVVDAGWLACASGASNTAQCLTSAATFYIYGHVGLTLRQHPVAFLREDLGRQKIVTWREPGDLGNGRWVRTAALVLVRQMPGSAKGVMFITIEEETGVANLVIWPKIFEQNRRVILGSRMLRVDGCIQREGDVVHLVARYLHDLSSDLARIGDRDQTFPLPHGRCDEGHHGGSGTDSRSPSSPKPRDI